MRQETIIKTYLTFDELSEDQKQKVIEKNYDINTDGSYWYEFMVEDYQTLLKQLGFENPKLFFSGFASQGDGASFTADFQVPDKDEELVERMANFIEHAPNFFETARPMQQLYLDLGFALEREEETSTIELFKRGRYDHRYSMFCDDCLLQKFARYMAGRFYRDLENHYHEITGESQIAETLKVNGYEFDADTLEIA